MMARRRNVRARVPGVPASCGRGKVFMKTVLLVNESAGSAGSGAEAAQQRARELGWDVCALGEGHASREARLAAERGYDLVVAGGGDGTIRAVVQGLCDARRPAALGVLPL